MAAKPSSLAVPPAPAWALRDAAGSIIQRRHSFPASPASEAAFTKSLFTDFNTSSCLEYVVKKKAEMVHYAFVAGATAIVEAAGKKESTDARADADLVASEDLPALVKQADAINRVRAEGFTIAAGGRDPTKKKKLTKAVSVGVNNSKPTATDTSKKTSHGSDIGADGGHAVAGSDRSGKSNSKDTPKFTRNTPASSAAALDSRLTSSRAILCAAANVAFSSLTPPFFDDQDDGTNEIDISDVPQNPNRKADSPPSFSFVSNMGEIVVEAQTIGQRIQAMANNATRRMDRRYQFRSDNLKFEKIIKSYQRVRNPFAWESNDVVNNSNNANATDYDSDDSVIGESISEAWISKCLPRLLSVLETGAGHAIYHDVQFSTRHGRIAHLFDEMSNKRKSFGPHLIVTTKPDVHRFVKGISIMQSSFQRSSSHAKQSIRAMEYLGDTKSKSLLRKLVSGRLGPHDSSFNVVVVSYSQFLSDYTYFCQVPFDIALVDDGASLMAVAQGDPNSNFASLWENAMWSKNDHQTGLAGSLLSGWKSISDFYNVGDLKESLIGLTARHRIITSSTLKVRHRSNTETIPVSGLVSFVAPHYSDMVREEWDRSRIITDSVSMEHFHKLLARSLVVHDSSSDERSIHELAMLALKGHLTASERTNDTPPSLISDEEFVSDGKVASSRRGALVWLGSPESSWLRYELGISDFRSILNTMKNSNAYGNLCEEILPASSTTSSSSAATGQLAGSLAFRLAVRCGRHFSSEQGLRQHLSASHAPPGTWLCRTCGGDCISSQARTVHERSCGQPISGMNGNSINAPSGPSATGSQSSGKGGRHQHGPAGVVGKKKGQRTNAAGAEADVKDPDGSIRVPGYRGVWVNQAGKHFVKIEGERYIQDGDPDLTLFESADDAARKYDSVVKLKDSKASVELNFKKDGKRIVYENVSVSSTSGLGGSASSVVPALSVINIKDLPPHVKPLLRDPRQTSRTGGNSKRHVYAYRGVCRQARKGHDRWQSQISFNGVNHYLGTYDSEWDSAAIYAWAHLILYGEEATRQAQKEGEEAAAAYEKEKRDIAAGIIPAAPEKKKKSSKKNDQKEKQSSKGGKVQDKKRPAKENVTSQAPKKQKQSFKADPEASVTPILSKSAGMAQLLSPKTSLVEMSDSDLSTLASTRVVTFQKECRRLLRSPIFSPFGNNVTPSIGFSILSSSTGANLKSKVPGKAMLLGLSPRMFGWSVPQFQQPAHNCDAINSFLMQEYGTDGVNEKFCCVIQGTFCVIGNATTRTCKMLSSLGFGEVALGGGIGSIDCHIGGIHGSCSENAACIRYSPASSGMFLFSALSDHDIVTWNGRRITPGMGSYPLSNNDVCSVGSRVFVFLVPTK